MSTPNNIIYTRYYPKLTRVLKVDSLPTIVPQVMKDAITNSIGQMHYKDLQVHKNPDGSGGFWQLALVCKRLDLPLFGSGFSLVLNPDLDDTQLSSFPVSLSLNWKVLALLRNISNIDLDTVSSDADLVFKIALRAFNLTETEVVSIALQKFVEPDLSEGTLALQQFVDDIDVVTSQDLTGIVVDANSTVETVLKEIYTITNSYSSTWVFTKYLLGSDYDETIQNLEVFFQAIFPYGSLLDYIKEVVTPHFDVTLHELSLGLAFPRSILIPLEENGDYTPDVSPGVPAQSVLVFDVGSFAYSTKTGFDYTKEQSFSLQKSQIGNTPLTIEIDTLKLDLRDGSNIPEADADGRPDSFKGVYVEKATIGLPNIFSASGSNNIVLVTKNMLIGSEGGISGTIGIDTPNENELRLDFEIGSGVELTPDNISEFITYNPSDKTVKIEGGKKIATQQVQDGETVDVVITESAEKVAPVGSLGLYIIDSENNYYYITNTGEILPESFTEGIFNFTIGSTVFKILDFYLTFNQNKVVSSTVTGLIEVDAFENDLKFEIDFTDGFRVLVYPDDEEGEVVINKPVELTLEELELGKAEEKLYVRFQGILKPKINLPIIGKYIPEVIDINNLLWKESEGLDYEIDLIWKNGLSIGITNDGPPQLNEFKKEITVHKNKESGFFHLDAIDFVIKPVDNGIKAGAYLRGAKFTFANAVTFALDQLGVEAVVAEDENYDQVDSDANIGPFKVNYEVVKPKGIGVAIDAKAVTGSGYLYFDKDAGEYSGFISLKIKDLVSVTALGVLNTKMPDGEEGYSFAVLISATGLNIPLFADFILDGLGGMLGIHRTVDTDVIRSGLRNKTMDSILFPEVTKKNFTKVVTDFKSVYPVKRKQFLFGPMARITKGKDSSKTTIDLGFMVEFPNPLRLIILGDVNIGLGKKDEEVLMVNVAFLGEINLTEKRILFDASIYDSRLAKFTIEGDMAFRLFWGEQKGFIMTVGGFHPDYTPPQHLMVNDVRRIRINFLTDKDYHLFIDTYFAITSNTVQFGALADLKFKFKKFLIKGQLGFDTLFQFNPFRFSVGIQAYIGIFWGSTELLGIGFSGKLVGTSPWSINGKVTFKVLLVSFTARFNKTWGDEGNALLEAIDVETLVANELASDKNWKVIMPDSKNKLVSYTVSNPDSTSIYVHPLGSLSVEQSVAPIGINLEHFENHDISGARRFEINQMTIGSQVVTDFTPTYDDFAPAQFLKMSDKEKLASKSYELLKNGIQASGDSEQDFESFVTCSADYDKTLVDVDHISERDSFVVHDYLNHYQFVKGGQIKRSPLSRKNTIKKERVLEKAVSIPKSGFAIVDEDLNYYNNDASTYTLNTRAEAQNMINQLINADPYLDGELSIVPEFELEV